VKIGVKRTSVRAWIVGIAVLFFAGFPTDVSAESNLAAPDFQTKASFDLVVQKSGPQTWRGQIGNPERIRHVHE
jgi:hypothetical protein